MTQEKRTTKRGAEPSKSRVAAAEREKHSTAEIDKPRRQTAPKTFLHRLPDSYKSSCPRTLDTEAQREHSSSPSTPTPTSLRSNNLHFSPIPTIRHSIPYTLHVMSARSTYFSCSSDISTQPRVGENPRSSHHL